MFFGEKLIMLFQCYLAILILTLLCLIIIATSVVVMPVAVILRVSREKIRDFDWFMRESWKLMVSEPAAPPPTGTSTSRPTS